MVTQNLLTPKLQDSDRISDWRVIFEARTEQLRAAENGERHVLQMLPMSIEIQPTEYLYKA